LWNWYLGSYQLTEDGEFPLLRKQRKLYVIIGFNALTNLNKNRGSNTKDGGVRSTVCRYAKTQNQNPEKKEQAQLPNYYLYLYLFWFWFWFRLGNGNPRGRGRN